MKARPLWSNFSLLFLLSLGFFTSACSFVGNSESVIKSKSIRVNFNKRDWQKIEADKADFAFMHDPTKSILLINSLCKKYDSTTLKQLTDNILAGLEKSELFYQAKSLLFKRASLRTAATGSLDGVQTSMLIEVVKRDRCIYDFALIATGKKISKSLEQSFDDLLNSTQVSSP